MMSDTTEKEVVSTSPPPAEEDLDKASKASSEATAPQASPNKKVPSSEFHRHVVPTEKSGAINVYVQVTNYFYGFFDWESNYTIVRFSVLHAKTFYDGNLKFFHMHTAL